MSIKTKTSEPQSRAMGYGTRAAGPPRLDRNFLFHSIQGASKNSFPIPHFPFPYIPYPKRHITNRHERKAIFNPLRKQIFVLLILFLSTLVFAGKKASLGGFDGFVERMGAATRELSRGNTGSADTSAMPGAYWNPGILGFRGGLSYTLHGERRDLDRSGGSLGLEGRVAGRMGIGAALLYRGDYNFDVISEDDENLGTASPYFMMGYVGLGYRISRKDGLGVSFSFSYDNLDIGRYYNDAGLVDSYRSPVTLGLGWIRQWNSNWSSSVVIRNLSFSSNLSARWDKNTGNNNSLTASEGLRPKVLQIGLGYRSRVFNRPISVWMEALDYQMADTLLVFDPDFHLWTARAGFEYEIFPRGMVRLGMDDSNYSLGFGYRFEIRIGKTVLPFDISYALVYESEAELWNPLSFGVRGWIL
jgi:hypothetical protein